MIATVTMIGTAIEIATETGIGIVTGIAMKIGTGTARGTTSRLTRTSASLHLAGGAIASPAFLFFASNLLSICAG